MATGAVRLPISAGSTDLSDADAAVGDVLTGKTFYSVEEPRKTGTMPNRGEVDTDISTADQVVTIQDGYHNGSGTVQIAAAEQAKIIAENIKKDIEILGVTGTMEGATTPPANGLETFGAGSTGSLGYITPFNLDSDNDWDMVAVGDQHGLAIKAGKLYGWGNNGSGRIGLGITSGITITPTQVGTADDWWLISAGFDHSVGIRKTLNGEVYEYTLWVWGEGAQYATGLNATTDLSTPTQVGTDTDWEWCSAGYQFSCAIKGGKLYTCGTNGSYKTGQNTTTGSTTVWTNYDSESTGWTKCFAGYLHGLGVKSGELWAWGESNNGRTGMGNTTDLPIPTHTDNGTGWSHGSAGNAHSAMIKTDGTLWTFGRGTNGRLGQGNTTEYQSPTQVGTATDWQQVKCNGNTLTVNYNEYTYAIKGGKLYATGLNNIGQLGMAPSDDVLSFTEIGNGSNYTDLGAGSGYGMAIRRTT